MIHLNFQNALSDKKNGLSESALERFSESHQKNAESVFRLKRKPGYAFLSLPEDVNLVKKINQFVRDQKKNKWENIVALGIGGSALGGIAAQEALLGFAHNLTKKPRLFFIDNIDPDCLRSVLEVTGFTKTLFLVVSKSGGTIEPMAIYSIVRKKLERELPKTFRNHLVFVTDPKMGALRRLGRKENIAMFGIPPGIGGRFSALTAAGLLPLALAGADIGGMMEGARTMAQEIRKKRGLQNPALTLAFLQYLMDRRLNKTMTVMMPYCNRLFRLGDWYRQLLAESVGKNQETGPTPINALGATDQHSQLQLWNDGPADKWFIFLRVRSFQNDFRIRPPVGAGMDFLEGKKLSAVMDASYRGTSESLAKNSRPNVTLEIPSVTPQTVGALFLLFEFQIALLGILYKVDAFSQPGVEEGKKITKQILSEK